MTVKLITDSTSYIDPELQRELDITVVPLSVHFPDVSYLENEVDYQYFYQKIEQEGVVPTSSQPAQGDMEGAFNSPVAAGSDILGIFISSLMSGTYQLAYSVKERLTEQYSEHNIEIIDSHTNCMAMGLAVIAAAQAARQGKSLLEVSEIARATLSRTHFYFVPAGLDYLKKGGRIGGGAALLGSLLQIRPILWVDQGRTEVLEKIRGNRAAVERMLAILSQDLNVKGIQNVLIHHINCADKAAELAETIKRRFGLMPAISAIGPVIGLHVGPGTLGIVYVTEKA